ncbi:hypothetical protein [Evansella tamaricis]|uniref:Glycine zipper family protein n=1 Tax=Evansella tamaricis TaxID=2069301 RepID=A0ABS6JF89_9BACI|nr:hypothetical protein [Evansella tamaricis]MBU9712336.1 hypothetical protein [Evansella tamaricis]
MEKKVTNYFIPAGLLIGLGIGKLFDQPIPGGLIGLGLGFLSTIVSSIVSSNSKES